MALCCSVPTSIIYISRVFKLSKAAGGRIKKKIKIKPEFEIEGDLLQQPSPSIDLQKAKNRIKVEVQNSSFLSDYLVYNMLKGWLLRFFVCPMRQTINYLLEL